MVLPMAVRFISWTELDHYLQWVRGRVNFTESELAGFYGWNEIVDVHRMGEACLVWTKVSVKHFEQIQSFLDCDLDKMPRSPNVE
jgi:hypothetical protein